MKFSGWSNISNWMFMIEDLELIFIFIWINVNKPILVVIKDIREILGSHFSYGGQIQESKEMLYMCLLFFSFFLKEITISWSTQLDQTLEWSSVTLNGNISFPQIIQIKTKNGHHYFGIFLYCLWKRKVSLSVRLDHSKVCPSWWVLCYYHRQAFLLKK